MFPHVLRLLQIKARSSCRVLSSSCPARHTPALKYHKAEADICWERKKIKKKMLEKKLQLLFQNTLRPHVQICLCLSPLHCFLLPLGSSSNVSHGPGGLCTMSSLPTWTAPLTLLSPLTLVLSAANTLDGPLCLHEPGLGSPSTWVGNAPAPPISLAARLTEQTPCVGYSMCSLGRLPGSHDLAPCSGTSQQPLGLSFPSVTCRTLCCVLVLCL